MCGIAGFCNRRDDVLIRRMAERITHRGPDSDGFHITDDVSLGMRRLAVIDVDGGAQPIYNETKRFALVFNGEIYNFRELRDELRARGHSFRTDTDTEVIVHLYEEHGTGLCGYLNGIFAIALWDEDKKRLFLARDHMGVKPLYYAQVDGMLAFASEMKALLELPSVSREISPVALRLYLETGSIPAPHTILKGIHKLEAGHWLTVSDSTVRIEPYWHVPEPQEQNTETPGLQEIQLLLENAICRQLMSDVPLGVFLSGGLDSSAIVAFASRHVSGPLKTFSVGYHSPDESYNELDKARRVANQFGCDHREFILSPRIQDLLAPLIRGFDEPFADSSAVPTYLISREARKHVTVALTGVGGDELFAGYPRYLGLLLGHSLRKWPQALRAVPASLAGLMPDFGGSINWTGRAKRFLKQLNRPPDVQYSRWTSFLSPELLETLISDSNLVSQTETSLTSCLTSPSSLARTDLLRYLPDDLLCLTDRVSMANSIEARVPFLDIPLVEYMARVPLSAKLRGMTLKRILKDIMKPLLPEEIITQTKKGFSIPLARWIREELNDLISDCLSDRQIRDRGYFRPEIIAAMRRDHARGRENHADALWSLLVLELWHREYMRS